MIIYELTKKNQHSIGKTTYNRGRNKLIEIIKIRLFWFLNVQDVS